MTLIKNALMSMTLLFIALIAAAPANGQLTQRCNWGANTGVGAVPPTVWPNSTQVMMMPVVMDFEVAPFGTSKVAFISFENASQINRDGGGVLRIIDNHCHEIARFPDPGMTGVPPTNCPANIFSHFLAPASGLAAGRFDGTSTATIVAVLDEVASQHYRLVGLKLLGGNLVPKWCSSPLPAGDFIPSTTAPAIAQLDGPNSSSSGLSEIIIDNKVFDSNGTLRYTGFTSCASCPRSRTAVVANVLPSQILPQVITGRGLYQSTMNLNNSLWTGTLDWTNSTISNNSLVYPAVAEIVTASPGPEIVVTDTIHGKVFVLASGNGAILASAGIPGGCGGPPMIGDADGVPGPEIGVAGCNHYTLFKYNGGSTLSVVWPPKHTSDPSGQTTSTLFNNPTGRRIFYADQDQLLVINGMTGTTIQTIPNSSNTAIEGPVIAALDNAPGSRGELILAANNYLIGSYKGVRIFDDIGNIIFIGPANKVWNEYSYHVTNVGNSLGDIPMIEPLSWLSPAQNTYRVQQ